MSGERLSNNPESSHSYEDKLGRFYERRRQAYVTMVRGWLSKSKIDRIIPNKGAAEDIVQEAFLALLKNEYIDFNRNPVEIEAYVIEQLRFKVKNYYERYFRNKPANPLSVPESVYVPLSEAEHVTIEHDGEAVELQKRINDATKIILAIKNLTPVEKYILIAHYTKGHTYREIADYLGLGTHQAVEGHKKKAFEKIKINSPVSKRLKELINLDI